ncbi:MAG: GMC family oxidoreductase N-terminal domain-containing protein [Deltaproteobacteria bacterium]|nr:GMC family oxidoreductase N-terminal domain-containing protein [Deltaproteobacteria bacterium]
MGKTVDYVIVGAGSAGCVMAGRLSERERTRVALLEAGGPDNALFVRAPGLYSLLWRSKRDWGFRTEPQAHGGSRRHFWPRGKVLGGSSALNAMIYIRGHRSNYDDWRDAGNPGWGYDDVLPFFKKSENWRGPPSEHHGTGGPLEVGDAAVARAPCADAFVEAAIEAHGYRRNDDFNGAEQEGVGRYHYTLKGNRRWSAADAFLHPARSRRNLEVVTHAHAVGLVIEKGRAVGVRYVVEGSREIHTLRAEREVIVCGGAVGSPHLLMLSGIGRAAELEKAGVTVVHDLPGVGKNLQDHLMAFVQCTVAGEGAHDFRKLRAFAWAARYALGGGGPMSHPPVHTGGFVKTSPSERRPNLQFHVVPWGMFTPNTDEPCDPDTGRFLSILPSLIYPKSRGEIRLRDASPTSAPIIDPRYFSERADMDLIVDGLEIARAIAAARPLAAHCTGEDRPGSKATSRDALASHVREAVNTLFHPVGTCKMGPKTDPSAVVDADLRVHGIEGLRVVDGSVMPTIVGGNTHAPIVMIAEKTAAALA